MTETLQAKHHEYTINTYTEVDIPISNELGNVLKENYAYNFEYMSEDIGSLQISNFEEILEEWEDLVDEFEITENDKRDVEDILDVLRRVDRVMIEIAL